MPDFSKQRTKTTKLVKKVSNQAADLQATSTKHVTKYFTKRKDRITGVRRFVVGWLALVIFLCVGTFATWLQLRTVSRVATPIPGGTYTDGMIGTLNNLNPLFGGSTLDDSTAQLLFNGLLRYDTSGDLVGDLASTWRVDDTHKTYFVDLKPNIKWHDGEPFSAQDVVYTIGAIQNPEARSTLYSSWQGVKVSAVNANEVKFELPAPFAPFPNALTVPILPAHLLSEIPTAKLRTAQFNTSPVGTGPFVFSTLRAGQGKQQQLELVRNKDYFRGAPKLDRFILHTFPDDQSLSSALKNREITAAVDLKASTITNIASDTKIRPVDMPLNSGVFAFFKTTGPVLSDVNLRTSLVESIDRDAIIRLFKARYAVLKTPLLPTQLGYDAAYAQQTDLADAAKRLDAAGWSKQPNGQRAKGGVKLELNLTTVDSAEYTALSAELQKQWGAIGVTITPQLLTAEQLQQTALTAHTYDILLYGISIGSDPDVYAYWHSSQARAGGLNFSEWKSSRADSSLEVARTRLEPVLRTARYKTFLDEWKKSSPAVALYQPRVDYAYNQSANGFVSFPVNNVAERFTNVEDWTVNTKSVTKTP